MSSRQQRRRKVAGVPLEEPALSGPARTMLTQKKLAELHGLSPRTIRRRTRKGERIDEILLNPNTRTKPVLIAVLGQTYPSLRAAARALGTHDKKIRLIAESNSRERSKT